ncbi:MAG: hypothetical protein QOH10_582, partial [Actinomycetota bacterium]|nr:hypothetical protein [Actinomycetota bacterium]
MTGVRRTAAWGVVALGLVAIVAMEAHGAAWSKGRNAHGSGEVRSLPHAVIVAGMVCAAVLAFALFLLALVRSRAAETPEHRRRRWAAAIAVLVVLGVARLLVRPSHATRAR